MKHRSVRASRPLALVSFLLALALSAAPPASAVEEGLQELRLPPLLVEQEIQAETGSELPPPTYPVQHVDQLPFHGAWHEFVNVTTGGLVFRMPDMKLPGRMPIDFGRIYDSKISNSLPPPPPGGPDEARWDEDLGKNWILGYTAYLIPAGTGYNMATTDGDVVRWALQSAGVWVPLNGTASKHMILEQDGLGLIETQTDGTRWTFTYAVAGGATHGLTKIEDRSGNWVEMIYGMGRLVEIRNSDGASLTVHRDHNGSLFPEERVTKVADAANQREVLFDYNTQGLLTSVTDVVGNVWTFAYGANKKVISATDPLGNVYLTATYNAAHRVATYEGQNGPWTFTYSGVRTLVDDAFGKRWEYKHAGAGITTQITEPTGGIHALTLDSSKNPAGYTDPEGVAVSWTYNTNHLPTSYTPAGVGTNSITYSYHTTEHWVTSVTGLDGGVTAFVRDAAGRVTEEVKPDGGRWTATYDSATGDRLTLTLPLGNVAGGTGYEWTFVYDDGVSPDYGLIRQATDPTGRVFEFDYTGAGDLWKFRRPDPDPQGYAEWIYTRDAAGKITGVTDPLGNTWTRTYDTAGRLVTLAGPAGTTVQYGYDARHRITTATVVDGVSDPVTTYAYDNAGRLASKTLPNGSTWSYGYDNSSRLVSVTDPLARSWTYGRDLAGRVVSITHPGGQVVTLDRDTAGRLAARTYPGGRIETFTYSSVTDRLTSAVASVGTGTWTGRLDWAYDLMGRPDSVKTTVTDASGTEWRELQLGYDVNGNRTSLVSVPIGETISYSYDELDRLIETDSDIYDDWTVTHDADSGHRTGVFTTGRSTEWSYDIAGQVVDHLWDWPAESDSGAVTLTYDAEGRIASDSAGGILREITWGALGRPILIEEIQGATVTDSYAMVYDDTGRLLSRLRTADTGETEEWAFDWDAAGRLTYARHDDLIRTYEWDDAPSDPAAALRVLRLPTTTAEQTLEIYYGFDGRPLRIDGYDHYGTTPHLMGQYHWAPLQADRLLEWNERQEDETYLSARSALDYAGYYAEVSEAFADLSLVSPDLGVDESDAALTQFGGLSMPAQAAPFGLGSWRGSWTTLATPEKTTLSDFVTSVIQGRLETAAARVSEQRLSSKLGTLARPSFPSVDVTDDWLKGMLLGKRLVGDDRPPSQLGWQGLESNDGPVPQAGQRPVAVCGPQHCLGAGGAQVQEMMPHGSQPDCECPYFGIYEPNPQPIVVGCHFDFDVPPGYQQPVRYSDVSEGGVSLANGEFVHEVTDLSVFDPGGDITFTRTYRSGIKYVGTLGHKWLHNWDEKVLIGTGNFDECGSVIRWLKPDGTFIDFHMQSSGSITNPPESPYRMKSIGGGYELRHVGGSLRTFLSTGSGSKYPLTELQQGERALTYVYDANDLLTEIKNDDVTRLRFYYSDGRLTKVENGIDASDYVQFSSYTTCGELKEVLRPATQLESGGDAFVPRTVYSYANHQPAPNPYSPYTCDAPAYGEHLLTSISEAQLDPVQNPNGSPELEVRLVNAYGAHSQVARQCFATTSCASGDLEYSYPVYSENGTVTHAVIEDHRPTPSVVEQHEFQHGLLTRLIEDKDGLNRETTYEYDDGVLTRTVLPDGRCEETTYTTVNGALLPETTRLRTKEVCDAPTHVAYHSTDQITYRTYEGFGGRVRSITTTEAFLPDGNVPEQFDPYTQGIEYTTFVYYDYDEGATSEVSSFCSAWNLATCPATDPGSYVNLNTDTSNVENDNWFGTVVKVTRTVPTDGCQQGAVLMATSDFHPDDGRLVRKTYPDGTSTRVEYFTTASWDLGDPHSPTGSGPVAVTGEYPSTGPEVLATRHAWSTRNQEIATQDPQGIKVSRTFATSGALLAETIECGESPCTPVGEVLNTQKFTYDLRGRLLETRTEDPAQDPMFETALAYDELDRPITSTVDPNGLSLTSTTAYYGRSGRVEKTISPASRTACFEYDGLDRVITTWRKHSGITCTVESNDLVATTVYDVMDRPVAQTDPDGISTYLWYDAHGRLEFVADGVPTSPAVVYGNPPENPVANWWAQTSYDEANRPTRELFYGRDVAVQGAAEGFLRVSWHEYDTLGRSVADHVGIGLAGTFVPEAASSTPPSPEEGVFDVATTETCHNGTRVYRSIDPLGRETDYTYDSFGRPETILVPEFSVCRDSGESCSTDLDCDTEASEPCQAHRDSVVLHYDEYGRRDSLASTGYAPDAQALATTSQTIFDDWGRVSRTIGGPGQENLLTDYAYDLLGRQTWQIRRWSDDPQVTAPALETNDRAVERVYDTAGRIQEVRVRESETGSKITSYAYDDDGLVVSMTDAEGHTTDWEPDAFGFVRRMKYPLDQAPPEGVRQTVDLIYNGRGLPERIEFRADDSVDDGEDDVVRVTRNMQYDDWGRLTSRTAALENDDPSTQEFFGTEEQHFKYDDLGRLIEGRDYSPSFGADADIVVDLQYDSGGRRLHEDQRLPLNGTPKNHVIDSTYGLDGFRTKLEFPTVPSTGRYFIDFGQDAVGRLEWMRAPVSPTDGPTTQDPRDLARYRYVGGRVWSRWHGNETELRMYDDAGALLYDGLGRITGMRTLRPEPAETFTDFRYGHDRVGNVTYEQRRHEPIADPENSYRTRAYTTDYMGRLRTWTDGALGVNPIAVDNASPASAPVNPTDHENWTLDLVGNWSTREHGDPDVPAGPEIDTFEANPLNQYTELTPEGGSPEPFSHDWLGQLRTNDSRGQQYVWDLFGRLTKVLDATGEEISRYRYDAFNRRVERHVFNPAAIGGISDATTWFIYDGWRAIEERAVVAPGEIVRARYGYGLGLDELLWMDRDVARLGGIPDPIGGLPNDVIEARYFVHHDRKGNAIALTDDPATATDVSVVERFTYSEYGEVTAWWAPSWANESYGGAAGLSKHGLPFLFTGQRLDVESGLHYFKNRQYDPQTGRFLRRDLLGYADGPALYQYAQLNPVMRTDPLGLITEPGQSTNPQNRFEANQMFDQQSQGAMPETKPFMSSIGVERYITKQFMEDFERQQREGWAPCRPLWGDGDAPLDSSLEESEKVTLNLTEFCRANPEAKGCEKPEKQYKQYSGGGSRTRPDFLKEVGLTVAGVLFEPLDWAMLGYDIYQNGFHWTHAMAMLPGVPARTSKWAREGIQAASGVCFAPGTLVETRKGLRPIDELRPGNLVLSRDEQTGKTEWRRVVQLFETPDQEVLELRFERDDGPTETLRVTAQHPFRTDLGWARADHLAPGTLVLTSSGGWIRLASATWAPERLVVYNIEVDEFHTYFVGASGAWVHNACDRIAKEVIERGTPGADGATSRMIRETLDGDTISVTHQVDLDGKIIHQHQTHVGTHGTERQFPDEWVEYPTIPATPPVAE